MGFYGFIIVMCCWFFFPTSQTCVHKENVGNNICDCDPLDSSNGWSYTCLDHNFQVVFIVKHVVDQSMTFECGEGEPEYRSALQQSGLIRKVSFKYCPLPNNTYSEILTYDEDHPIEQLEIEGKKGNETFTSEMLGNLSSYLQRLVLSNNEIERIPESLFENFTNLQLLSLTDNKLKGLPVRIFADLKNLHILEISNNALETLRGRLFENLHSLERLYLSKNRLKELPNNVFNNLSNLQVLDLADNHLILLPDDVFHHLSSLIHVRLRGNWLGTVPQELFNGSLNLKDIDLSFNRLMEPLPEFLLSGLTQLDSLSINDCNLTLIYPSFFENCYNLTRLDLSSNSLTSLPENIFQNNSLLKQINLNFNFINELDENIFSNQMALEKLSLFKNNLSHLPTGLFKRARNIKTLVLGRNTIQKASKEIFQHLPYIESLDLKSNNLTHFSLALNDQIREIDLSHNMLTKLPALNWITHLRLEKFDMEYNHIEYLPIPLLSSSKRNPILNFANNDIQTVDVEDILFNDRVMKDLPSKDYDDYVETRVVLNSNPFTCDCKLYEFYEYLKKNNELSRRSVRFDAIQNMTCKQPMRLGGKKITELSPSQFTCDIKEQCSEPCHCYNLAKDNTNVVNCSNHELENVPKRFPNETNIVYFQKNRLTSLEGFSGEIWQNLTELFVDDNKITHLENWNIPFHLKNISLKGNRLTHLSPAFMNFFSSIEGMNLKLSENPWYCNCSTINFKNWLTQHYQRIKDVRDIKCINKLRWNGTMVQSPILRTPDDILCPVSDWPYKLHLITVTVICVILFLLLFIVSVLYYRNKQTVIAYVYIHMQPIFNCFFSQRDMDEDKVFDAFVAYSSHDRDVTMALIEELEKKEPRFRLCIHERDFIAGQPISWNIINSVHNSKRTILVLSKEFLDSLWFQIEFHAAYYQMLEDKIDRLIIIVKGELPSKNTLDKDLQYLLTTKTYLVWDEKWFWEKLRYALPHKKQLLPSEVLALKDKPPTDKVKPVDAQIAIMSGTDNGVTDVSVQSFTNTAFEYCKDEIYEHGKQNGKALKNCEDVESKKSNKFEKQIDNRFENIEDDVV